MRKIIIGCDLATAVDATAVVAFECVRNEVAASKEDALIAQARWARTAPAGVNVRPRPIVAGGLSHIEYSYRCLLLDRWTNISYTEQCSRLRRLLLAGPLREENVTLVIDFTGVGRPVAEMLRSQGLKPICVTITAGTSVNDNGWTLTVPKADLVSVASILHHNTRVTYSPQLRLGERLVSEFAAFQRSTTATGRAVYGGKGEHDDLVLATALALWQGERDARKESRKRSPVQSWSFWTGW